MATLDENPIKQSLLKAIRKGNCQKVREILTTSGMSPNETVDSAQNRLLHKAARYGKVNVVKTLIEDLNADPNGKNKFDMTPLHHAAVEGSAEVIEQLLKSGADSNLADNAQRLPLHWTCANGFFEATEVLLDKGKSKFNAKDKDGFTPLLRCCQESPMTKDTPSNNDQTDQKTEKEDEEDKTKQDKSRAEIIKALVAKGASIKIAEPQGIQSALHLAAMNGYDKVCNALVNLGADPNVTNKISKTPLIYAAAEGHVKVLEVLVKCPNIDLEAKDQIHYSWTALHYAVLRDNPDCLKVLVRAGADCEQKDGLGRSPLMIAGDHEKKNAEEYLKTV